MQLVYHLIEHNRYMNFIGIVIVFCIAFLFSQNRTAINKITILKGFCIQFLFALIALKTSLGIIILEKIAGATSALYLFANEGIRFIFGELTDVAGPWGFLFGIQVLPIIIFFSAFTSILFNMGIIQFFVNAISKIIQPFLHITGPESLCAVANAFLGQTEAPLLVRHYLDSMTKSELFVVMVSGMGTISGSLLIVLIAVGLPAKHLLAASVMGIPGTIIIGKILLPETEKIVRRDSKAVIKHDDSNVLDAISTGTREGMMLALNVGAMLIAFISLIAMLNYIILVFISYINTFLLACNVSYQFSTVTIEYMFGIFFSPFAYLMGFSGEEAMLVGSLLGTKVAVNEVIAFGNMQQLGLSTRTIEILTYALCGFSNFSCIGIQIGGIGSLVPSKRKWLAEIGVIRSAWWGPF